jgi:hypothetical protein
VEIVEQEMLGALPTVEDVPEQNVQVNPMLFDFFGLGQQGVPPPPPTTAEQSKLGSECLW